MSDTSVCVCKDAFRVQGTRTGAQLLCRELSGDLVEAVQSLLHREALRRLLLSHPVEQRGQEVIASEAWVLKWADRISLRA